MTREEVTAIVRGIAPVLRNFVDQRIAAMRDELRREFEDRLRGIDHRGMTDLGPWSSRRTYQRGDAVTFNDATWICRAVTTSARPDTEDWTLSSSS